MLMVTFYNITTPGQKVKGRAPYFFARALTLRGIRGYIMCVYFNERECFMSSIYIHGSAASGQLFCDAERKLDNCTVTGAAGNVPLPLISVRPGAEKTYCFIMITLLLENDRLFD